MQQTITSPLSTCSHTKSVLISCGSLVHKLEPSSTIEESPYIKKKLMQRLARPVWNRLPRLPIYMYLHRSRTAIKPKIVNPVQCLARPRTVQTALALGRRCDRVSHFHSALIVSSASSSATTIHFIRSRISPAVSQSATIHPAVPLYQSSKLTLPQERWHHVEVR